MKKHTKTQSLLLFICFLLASQSFATQTKKDKCDFIARSMAVASSDSSKHILKNQEQKDFYKEMFAKCLKETDKEVEELYQLNKLLLREG